MNVRIMSTMILAVFLVISVIGYSAISAWPWSHEPNPISPITHEPYPYATGSCDCRGLPDSCLRMSEIECYKLSLDVTTRREFVTILKQAEENDKLAETLELQSYRLNAQKKEVFVLQNQRTNLIKYYNELLDDTRDFCKRVADQFVATNPDYAAAMAKSCDQKYSNKFTEITGFMTFK
jgi:hypothetical protein